MPASSSASKKKHHATSRRNLRSESRPYENASSSRNNPGGNNIPLRTASASPSGDAKGSVVTARGYSAASRSRIAFAWVQNVHCSWVSNNTFIIRYLLCQASPHVGKQIGNRNVHGIIGRTTVVGSPFNCPIRTNDDKTMSVAAGSHHAITVRTIRLRDRQCRVRQHRKRDALISNFLFERTQRVGGDADNLTNAQCLEGFLLRLDIFKLCPAGFTVNAFLKIE